MTDKPEGYVYGRPTPYKEEFCQLAIECGKKGMSIAEIGAECGVSKQTVYNWMKTHKSFFDAMQTAVSLAQSWYEKMGRENVITDNDKKFNTALYNKIVSCRFRDDYSETSTVYNKTLESQVDEVPETQIDKIAKEIAKDLKEEF